MIFLLSIPEGNDDNSDGIVSEDLKPLIWKSHITTKYLSGESSYL